jgi:hypothetical protein
MEDWQLSSRESLTDLLFTEGQSRETYNVATSNMFANWENGVGNLLGDKPERTGWENNAIVAGTVASDSVGSHRELRFGYFFDETLDSESSDSDQQRSDLPKLPKLGENGSKVFQSYYPSFSAGDYTDAEMVAYRTDLLENIALLKLAINEVRERISGINYAVGSRGAIHLPESTRTEYLAERKLLTTLLEKLDGQLSAALATEYDLVHTINERRLEEFWKTHDKVSYSRRGLPPGLLLKPSELDANVSYYQTQIAIEVLTLGLGKLAHLRHLSKARLAAKANQEVIEHVDELVKLMDDATKGGSTGFLSRSARVLTGNSYWDEAIENLDELASFEKRMVDLKFEVKRIAAPGGGSGVDGVNRIVYLDPQTATRLTLYHEMRHVEQYSRMASSGLDAIRLKELAQSDRFTYHAILAYLEEGVLRYEKSLFGGNDEWYRRIAEQGWTKKYRNKYRFSLSFKAIIDQIPWKVGEF